MCDTRCAPRFNSCRACRQLQPHGLLSSQPHGLLSSQPTVYYLHSRTVYDLRGDVTAMLELGGALIGTFQQLSCTLEPLLEPYKVPDSSLSGKSGSCEEAQRDLPRSLASDARVIRAFDALVEGVVLPRDLTARFAAAGAQLTASTAFYTSTISTLRLCGCSHAQAHGTCGGTTRRRVRPSARRTRNFWMPLTDCILVVRW